MDNTVLTMTEGLVDNTLSTSQNNVISNSNSNNINSNDDKMSFNTGNNTNNTLANGNNHGTTTTLDNNTTTDNNNQNSSSSDATTVPIAAPSNPLNLKVDASNPSTTTASNDGTLSAAPIKLAVPSLRGHLATEIVNNNTIHKCRGLWALSDELHNIAGQTSEFEFKLNKAKPDAELQNRKFPLDGKYTGFFKLRNQKGGKSKFDDTFELTFTPAGSGHLVKGDGKNQFGSFAVNGTLDMHGNLQMYRHYTPKTPRPKTPRPAKLPMDNTNIGVAAKTNDPTTKRERKQTGQMVEFMEAAAAGQNRRQTAGNKSTQNGTKGPSSKAGQRMNPALIKCVNILTDLERLPSALYFLAAVDHVKLGIPDYPQIIKTPMDLGTVRSKLTTFGYEGPADFAYDMRLTFRNAIEYNQSRDHPVHKAAREMSAKFEQRYLSLSNTLTQTGLGANDPLPRAQIVKPKSKSRSGGSKSGHSRRVTTGGMFMAAPVVDSGGEAFRAMQQQMLAMQQELERLRQAELKRDAVGELAVHRQAAENPLTIDEKRVLVDKIHKLPSQKMARIAEIIQESIPPEQRSSGDVEIPIDDLDTYTLRRLQDYVKGGKGGGGNRGGGSKKRKAPSGRGSAAQQHSYKPAPVKRSRGPPSMDAFGTGNATLSNTWDGSVSNTMSNAGTSYSHLDQSNEPLSVTRDRSDSLEAADLLETVDSFIGEDDIHRDDLTGMYGDAWTSNSHAMPSHMTNGMNSISNNNTNSSNLWSSAVAESNAKSITEVQRQEQISRMNEQRQRMEDERARQREEMLTMQARQAEEQKAMQLQTMNDAREEERMKREAGFQ